MEIIRGRGIYGKYEDYGGYGGHGGTNFSTNPPPFKTFQKSLLIRTLSQNPPNVNFPKPSSIPFIPEPSSILHKQTILSLNPLKANFNFYWRAGSWK